MPLGPSGLPTALCSPIIIGGLPAPIEVKGRCRLTTVAQRANASPKTWHVLYLWHRMSSTILIDLVHANRKLELMVIWISSPPGSFYDTPAPPLILYRLTWGPTQSSRCL